MGASVRVGISGWRYKAWRGKFYPKGLVQRRELEYASGKLDTIEINGTFYSLQRPECFERWRSEVPDDFVFAIKGGRFLTHMKKLRDPDQPLANFFAQGLLALGPMLGPILWQLPEMLGFDEDRLGAFFDRLPRDTEEAAALAANHGPQVEGRALVDSEGRWPIRYALEPRHRSFFTPRAVGFLDRHGISLVVADTAGRFPMAEAPTADFAYVRLHGSETLYWNQYQESELDVWAERIQGWKREGRDVYVYFDNDAAGHAPFDAIALAKRLG